MKIFGIDPGSERTGYGCVETDGSRHRLVVSGAISDSGAGVVSRKAPHDSHRSGRAARRVPARLRRHRESVSRDQRPQRAEARTRARRRDAGGRRSRPAGRRVHAGRNQARGRRLRPRREAPGAADGEAAARSRDAADAARCRRCAGGGDLPLPRRWRSAPACRARAARAKAATSWRHYRPARS